MNDYIHTKLRIHEYCNNGYITESEKNELLDLLESDNENKDDEEKKKEIKKYVKSLTKITVIIGILIIACKAAKKYSNDKHGFDVTIKELERFSNECHKNIDDALVGKINVGDCSSKRLDALDKAAKLISKCKNNPFIKLTPDQEKRLSYMQSEIACGGWPH